MKKQILFIFMAFLLFACSDKNNQSDAYGNFEAVEVQIASEVSGKLLKFDVEEGMKIPEGQIVALIDSNQLFFSLRQLEAQKSAISSKFPSIVSQLNVLKQQKENALKDKERIDKMFAGKAATQKQLDDINGALSVIDRQLQQIETQNSPVMNELKGLDAQIAKTKDMLSKCSIVNPVAGTVLNKFVEQSELVTPGKVLYKIANLDYITLRVYVAGSQLSSVKIGQKVRVIFDKNQKETAETDGEIYWISPQAEFTPKIIQTREERVNMVYAVKIRVKNDGSLKIGMPGEIKL